MADKKIGGNYYRVQPILATEALRLQVRLLNIAGPAVKALPAVLAARKDATNVAGAEQAGLEAIAAVFTTADPDRVQQFITDVCEKAEISEDGKSYDALIFDHHMSDDQKSIIPLTLFVLKELLGDFFTEALAAGNLAIPKQG